jgi:hypothetical protein
MSTTPMTDLGARSFAITKYHGTIYHATKLGAIGMRKRCNNVLTPSERYEHFVNEWPTSAVCKPCVRCMRVLQRECAANETMGAESEERE